LLNLAFGYTRSPKDDVMKSPPWILCLGLGCLLPAGCSNSPRTSGDSHSEAERKAAEKDARVKRFEDLVGGGKKALQAKRFGEAVKDFEEAVRLQDTPQARELLQQSHKARLNGLWVLSRQEGRDSSFTGKGLLQGLLFEEDKVTLVYAMNGDVQGNGTPGSYKLDVSRNPKSIDIRWNERGKEAVTELGIYKLEKDTLTISWSEPGEQERPQEFNREKADIKYYMRVELGNKK
jgi:uncharacterized protein (TIGR03067 family)